MRESTHEITIWGNHLDLYQHVNHARYLEFLEEARWAHFGGLEVKRQMEGLGLAFVIVNINIDYRRACTMGDVLIIKTKLDSIGNKSAIVLQEILLKSTGKKVAEAKITFVLLDLKGQKAVLLDEKMQKIVIG